MPGGWNPSAYPNPNIPIRILNNGGNHRAIDIIDGGFLELVRMGVKRPNDPTITNSLIAYDGVIKQTIGSNAYPAWFRYNFDGYGETNTGDPNNNSRPAVADLRCRTGQLPDRRDGDRRHRRALSCRVEGLLDAAGLYLRADLESGHHAAGRHGQFFRLDRDHAPPRRHPRHHNRFDGAAKLGAGRIYYAAGRYRRRPCNRHPPGGVLTLLRLHPDARVRPGASQYQRQCRHAIWPIHVCDG